MVELKQNIHLLVQKVKAIDHQTKDILPVIFQKDQDEAWEKFTSVLSHRSQRSLEETD